MFFTFRNYNQEILDRLDALEDNMNYLYQRNKLRLNLIITKDEEMTNKFDNLAREVAEQVEVTASAIALIAGIAEELKEAGTDQAKLDELAATLDASQAAFAAAVAENTVAAPPVVEEPAPVVVEPAPAASTGEFAE